MGRGRHASSVPLASHSQCELVPYNFQMEVYTGPGLSTDSRPDGPFGNARPDGQRVHPLPPFVSAVWPDASRIPWKNFVRPAPVYGRLLLGACTDGPAPGASLGMFLGMARKAMKLRRPSRLRTLLLPTHSTCIAVCGLSAFFRRDLLACMSVQTRFVFLDFNEPVLLFYLDYPAMLGAFIFVTCYVSRHLRRRSA